MKQKISVCPCLFLKLKFSMGYNFTGGRIFDFPIDFCTGLRLDSAPACKAVMVGAVGTNV